MFVTISSENTMPPFHHVDMMLVILNADQSLKCQARELDAAMLILFSITRTTFWFMLTLVFEKR